MEMSIHCHKQMDKKMQKLHKSHNKFIQDRPWLHWVLDPGFVMAESLAPATLAALMGNTPMTAPGGLRPGNFESASGVGKLECHVSSG